MIWHGYTGAAGWMLREALEGVAGAQLTGNRVVLPADFSQPRGELQMATLERELARSPFASAKPSP
jgi:cellobiose phosphorylase